MAPPPIGDMPSLAHSRVEMLDHGGLPTVVIVGPEGRPFQPWIRYVETHRPGIGSQRSYARSIGLFIDFLSARRQSFMVKEQRHRLFQGFADALAGGTVANGADPIGLWWMPRSIAATRRVIAEVTVFTDWLAEEAGISPVNPARAASLAEEMAFWRVWRRATSQSLLKHIKSVERALGPNSRIAGARKQRLITTGEAKAFPEAAFAGLLTAGFKRSRQQRWTTLRDQMIALLLHGGGLRLSEVLHLWITDVFEDPHDPHSSVVRVFHPSDGLTAYRAPATGRTTHIARAQYLRLVYDRVPLTDLPGRKAVGWKDPLLTNATEKFMQVFWRDRSFGRAFMNLYQTYVQVRPRVTAHPYLFVAQGGEPMTVKGYEKVHAAAVRRIGMEAGKRLGTTPHGHRHAYGQWMRRANIDPKVRQLAMHHKSVSSQEIYTEADSVEVMRTFAEVERIHGRPLDFALEDLR